jgi:hypothetical protein
MLDLVHLERTGKILIGWEQRWADPAVTQPHQYW